jgi:hypothetical protein
MAIKLKKVWSRENPKLTFTSPKRKFINTSPMVRKKLETGNIVKLLPL